MSASFLRRAVCVPVLAMAMVVAGCDNGPSGTYSVEGLPVPITITFKSGKATFSGMGQSVESDYTVSGDKVTVAKDPDGKQVTFTMNKDGSLSGPEGIKFVKKS